MGMFDSPASFDAKILRQAKRRHRRGSPQRVVRGANAGAREGASRVGCLLYGGAWRVQCLRRPPSLDPKWYFRTDDCGRRVARGGAVRGTTPMWSSGNLYIVKIQTWSGCKINRETVS